MMGSPAASPAHPDTHQEVVMPVVTVQAWEGRTVDHKRRLVEAITRAMVEISDSTHSNTTVLIYDVPRSNWGRDGKLSSDVEAGPAPR